MQNACIDVCAAIIFDGTKLLLATRRGGDLAGLWEFPGGKCAPGETLEACIQREIQEELAGTVSHAEQVSVLTYAYPEKTVCLHFMLCTCPTPAEIAPQEGQSIGWFQASEISDLQFAPADKAFLDAARTGKSAVPDCSNASTGFMAHFSEWLRGI